MKNFIILLFIKLLVVFLMPFIVVDLNAQNPGFETTSNIGWTLESSSTTWTNTATSTYVRSGTRGLALVSTTDNAKAASHNTNYSITIPSSGTNYIYVIGYAKYISGGESGLDQGRVRALGTSTVNGTLTNLSTTGYANGRLTAGGLATNSGTYYPGFQIDPAGASPSGGTYAMDDIIIYTSTTSSGVDLTIPNPATSLVSAESGGNINLTWIDGTDQATNISGIEGTLIIRIAGDRSSSIPTPLPQTSYSTNSGIGPSTIVNGADTWTVLTNGTASGSYTNVGAAGTAYTYVVYMRDKAFNYSTGIAVYCNGCAAACAGTPSPGNTLSTSSSPCAGDDFTLSVQNSTTGTGVTYQWQSADNSGFTVNLANLGTSSTQITNHTSSYNKYYRCNVTCTGNTGTSNPVLVGSLACYCSSGATDNQDGRINRVVFNTIDQTSPNTCQTYTDYTAASTNVTVGSSYNLTIYLGSCNLNLGHRVRAWIDFNNNGIFDDPSERVFSAAMGNLDPLNVTTSVTIPSTSTFSSVRMRIVARWGTTDPGPCGTYTRGETEDYTINILPVTWTGSLSTDWNTGGNWNLGFVPGSTHTVIIPTVPSGNPSNFPFISTAAQVNKITIQNSASINIQSGFSLTIANDLINNGTVTVESGGSLVQSTGSVLSGSGSYNIKRTGTSSSSKFNFWSSPITNGSLPGSNGYYYNPSNGTHSNADDNPGPDPGWASFSGSMAIGKGYASVGGGAATFTGTINNGTINNIPVTTSGQGPTSLSGPSYFNLIGIPYPSSINATTFLSDNSGVIAGTIWLWDDDNSGGSGYTSGDYATRTSAGGTAGGGGNTPGINIGSCQGVFVKANSNGNIVFNNAQRGSTNTQFFKTEEEISRIWLSLYNDTTYNEILVAVIPNATDGYDNLYDGIKFRGNPYMSFAQRQPDDAEDIYAIAAYPVIENEKVIPLVTDVLLEGIYTIKNKEEENFSGYNVILEDRLAGTFTDLSNHAEYSTLINSQNGIDRFYLHLSPITISGLQESKPSSFKTWVSGSQMFVLFDGISESLGALRITDIAGREIFSAANINTNCIVYKTDISSLSAGIYVANFIGDNINISSKIIIGTN